MGWALVFSGQGLQHPEMLPWLERDDTMATLEGELGADWRRRLALPEEAGDNRRAQQLLTATACAAWSQLRARVPPPAVVVGYSVGELAAFAAAGVFDARTAIGLAARRAECMDQAAAAAVPTGLLGITGAAAGGVQELCARFELEVAIRIDAGSAVLGGRRSALLAAAEEAAGRGWRATPLNIAMASHTHWMQSAAAAFETLLRGVALRDPALALFSNALGRVHSAAAACTALSRQIAQTLPWDECMDAIAAQAVHAVLEIGPGQALARLWRNRHAEVSARSVDEFKSAHAIAAWLARQLP